MFACSSSKYSMGSFYVPDSGLIKHKCHLGPIPKAPRLVGRDYKMQVHSIPQYFRTTLGRATGKSLSEMISDDTQMNCVYAFILTYVIKKKPSNYSSNFPDVIA